MSVVEHDCHDWPFLDVFSAQLRANVPPSPTVFSFVSDFHRFRFRVFEIIPEHSELISAMNISKHLRATDHRLVGLPQWKDSYVGVERTISYKPQVCIWDHMALSQNWEAQNLPHFQTSCFHRFPFKTATFSGAQTFHFGSQNPPRRNVETAGVGANQAVRLGVLLNIQENLEIEQGITPTSYGSWNPFHHRFPPFNRTTCWIIWLFVGCPSEPIRSHRYHIQEGKPDVQWAKCMLWKTLHWGTFLLGHKWLAMLGTSNHPILGGVNNFEP